MAAGNWTNPQDAAEEEALLREQIAGELPALVLLARRLSRNEQDAADAVQDALERGWRRREQLRDRAAAGAWLRQIVARQVIDAQRRRADVPAGAPTDLDPLMPDVADPAEVVQAAEDELRLRAALHALPPSERVALVLHDGEGWPAADVAEALDVTPAAAHKRIQRARSRLVTLLAAQGSASPPGASCRDARAHAHALLEETLDPATAAAVQEHLATCPSCPAALQAAVGVLAALRERELEGPPPAELMERLDGLMREAAQAR